MTTLKVPDIQHLLSYAELRDMRKKADNDKKEEALAVKTMSSIEAKARQQYERDMDESSKALKDLTGSWVRFLLPACASCLTSLLHNTAPSRPQ